MFLTIFVGNPNIYIENEQQLVFKNPVVDMSGAIFCGGEGSAGYSYASSGLIVYGKSGSIAPVSQILAKSCKMMDI